METDKPNSWSSAIEIAAVEVAALGLVVAAVLLVVINAYKCNCGPKQVAYPSISNLYSIKSIESTLFVGQMTISVY